MLIDAGMTTGIDIGTISIDPISSDSSEGMVADSKSIGMMPFRPYVYMADWVKAVIAVLLLTVMFFI